MRHVLAAAVLTAAVVVGASTAATAGAVCPAITSTRDLGVVVPAYLWPASTGSAKVYWDQLVADAVTAKKAGFRFAVIVNPATSGHFQTVDPAYRSVVTRLDAAGALLIGYVYTSLATRPIGEVEADMTAWAKFYPEIDGFFLDETAATNANFAYYDGLRHKALQLLGSSAVLFANAPGGNLVTPRFRDLFTVTIAFEDYGRNLASFVQPSVVASASAGQIGYLVHDATEIAATSVQGRACGVARTLRYGKPSVRNAGWWFLTTDTQGTTAAPQNPYDTLGTEHRAFMAATCWVNTLKRCP